MLLKGKRDTKRSIVDRGDDTKGFDIISWQHNLDYRNNLYNGYSI